MIRRKQEEESHNHERWVISYADFITLLFAFFVVMYSISSVNDGKYKVLSSSLENVFSEKTKTLKPVQVGDNKSGDQHDRIVQLPIPGNFPSNEDFKYSIEGLFDDVDPDASVAGGEGEEDADGLGDLSDKLESALEGLIDDELASVNSTDDWIEVDIKSSVLFPSGAALPSKEAREIVSKVAQLLKEVDNPVHVEGFTDNVPIQNEFYPSNWELSAARAAAVVRLLEASEVAPARLAAVGYGEFQPVADNTTEDGRAKNRRVSMVISKQKAARIDKPASKVSDFKIGAVPSGRNGKSNESSNAFNPKNRREQVGDKKKTVPLKIIKLENGGILFSSESTKAR